ncbi:SufE family protein [Rhodothermus marinus]|uniref:SufE family protein n=1 Tax=Rhodothermus marinus TaxID=29549 RepID=UPI0037C9933C
MAELHNDTIEARARQLVEEFAVFDDWMEKYEYLIELGKSLPPLEPEYKTEAFRIHGCQSQVWIRPEFRDGRVYFKGDSDALITKGLVALLIRVLSGQPPEAIVNARLDFLDEIGLKAHLSPTRKNGLAAMIEQIRRYAQAYLQASRN